MEPLFKATRIMTEKYARELFRNTNFIYHFFNISMLLIAVFYNIYWAYWDYSINIIYIILFILAITSYISRPYTVARKRIKEYKAIYNATETDVYMFYDDFFITKDINSKSEIKIEYVNITSVKTTKNFYIFSIKNSKTKISLPKALDDESKKEEFINFINDKTINSKRKIK